MGRSGPGVQPGAELDPRKRVTILYSTLHAHRPPSDQHRLRDHGLPRGDAVALALGYLSHLWAGSKENQKLTGCSLSDAMWAV